MNLAPLALWLTPYFWDIFKMIGDAIQGALQWFWEHVILNIASLGGYESVLSLKNIDKRGKLCYYCMCANVCTTLAQGRA